MFHRTQLILLLSLLLFTAACGQVVSSPSSPAASAGKAELQDVEPLTMSTDTMAAAMQGMSEQELATHMAMMNIESVGTPTPFSTPTAFPTFTPVPTIAEASKASPAPTATPACSNLAEFVKHLTINDNTALEGGAGFAKLWRVKNAGTCTWTTDYALVFVTGEQLGGPASISLAQEVLPGQTIDLRVDLIAPHTPGFFTGSWMLQDAKENRFGLLPDGSQPLSLTIQIKPHAMSSGHTH